MPAFFCSHHTSLPGLFLPAGSSRGRANTCQAGSSPCHRLGAERPLRDQLEGAIQPAKSTVAKRRFLVTNYLWVVWEKEIFTCLGSCLLGMLLRSRQGSLLCICMGDAAVPGVPATCLESKAQNTR